MKLHYVLFLTALAPLFTSCYNPKMHVHHTAVGKPSSQISYIDQTTKYSTSYVVAIDDKKFSGRKIAIGSGYHKFRVNEYAPSTNNSPAPITVYLVQNYPVSARLKPGHTYSIGNYPNFNPLQTLSNLVVPPTFKPQVIDVDTKENVTIQSGKTRY